MFSSLMKWAERPNASSVESTFAQTEDNRRSLYGATPDLRCVEKLIYPLSSCASHEDPHTWPLC